MEQLLKIKPAKVSIAEKIQLVRSGKHYFDLLIQLIDQASSSIHLQCYIFNDDETGMLVANALKRAAQRKVEVYLLADGYASQEMGKEFITSLKESGVHFRFFEPIFKSTHFYFGRRMHHKIFVADTRYALVGGINISNRYNDMPGKQAWLDYAVYATGEIARDICVLCWKTWNGFPVKMGKTTCETDLPAEPHQNGSNHKIRMRRNDWVRRKNEISSSYIQMFHNAQSQITILCSYFLPGRIIRRKLKNASKRGVKIRIITAGPSDVMLAKHAERWLYDWLLRHKIELYEYQPSVLHAKLAVCDDEWLTAGSYNINDISAYASIELNLDVFDKNQAAIARRELDTIIKEDCIFISNETHIHSRNIFIQFVRWLSYKSIHIIFYALTFYYKQRR